VNASNNADNLIIKLNLLLKELVGEGDKIGNVKLITEYIVDFYDHYLNCTPFKSGLFFQF